MKKTIIATILLIALNACVSRVEKHGYMFDLSDYETLQEGVTTKERLLMAMGSPTLISDLDDKEAWIYYAEDVHRFLFFKPKIIARNVLVVRFDEFETVSELKKIDLTKEEKLHFTTHYTAVEGHKVGFFKSIFSNIGQVKPQ